MLARGFDALEIYNECDAITTTSRDSFSQSQTHEMLIAKRTPHEIRESLSLSLTHSHTFATLTLTYTISQERQSHTR